MITAVAMCSQPQRSSALFEVLPLLQGSRPRLRQTLLSPGQGSAVLVLDPSCPRALNPGSLH